MSSLPLILAYILSEEVEAVLNVGDRRFLRESSNPRLAEKCRHQRLNLVAQHFFGIAGNDEVIGIPYEIDPVGLGGCALRLGKGFPQPPLPVHPEPGLPGRVR